MHNFPPPRPAVESRRDLNSYINLCQLEPDHRVNVLERMETARPELHEMLTTDPFIEAMQKTFNAEIIIEKRKKHMIVIQANATPENTSLLAKLKKYFEVDHIIPDWNGTDEIDDSQTTLLITKAKPPYQLPYTLHTLTLEKAEQLLRS